MATFIKYQYKSMGVKQGGRITDEQLYLTLKESGCTLKPQAGAKAQVKRGSQKRAKIEDTAVVHDDDSHVCLRVCLPSYAIPCLLSHPVSHLNTHTVHPYMPFHRNLPSSAGGGASSAWSRRHYRIAHGSITSTTGRMPGARGNSE